jgi:hypothetical protein
MHTMGGTMSSYESDEQYADTPSDRYIFIPINDGLKSQYKSSLAVKTAYAALQEVLECDPGISDANLAK